MLCALFELEGARFAIDAGTVREILPAIELTRIPQAPVGIAGVCDHRGAPVPVIDLAQLLLGRPSHRRLSTRLVIVDYVDGQGRLQQLGLIAEKATQLVRHPDDAFRPSGVHTAEAPYLGSIAGADPGFIQRIEVGALLSDEVRDALFGADLR